MTAKVTIQGLHLGLLSGTGQQAQFQADDMILIVHNAFGAEAQRLGPQGLQLTTMDLTLAAAKLTVMGTGKLFVSGFVRTCCGSICFVGRRSYTCCGPYVLLIREAGTTEASTELLKPQKAINFVLPVLPPAWNLHALHAQCCLNRQPLMGCSLQVLRKVLCMHAKEQLVHMCIASSCFL